MRLLSCSLSMLLITGSQGVMDADVAEPGGHHSDLSAGTRSAGCGMRLLSRRLESDGLCIGLAVNRRRVDHRSPHELIFGSADLFGLADLEVFCLLAWAQSEFSDGKSDFVVVYSQNYRIFVAILLS